LTPQLAVELIKDEKVRKNLYPMSLRPQGHDIITFWLFNTVVKSRLHNKINPWKDVVISGHALDPHGRKMSKSKGNVVDPKDVLNKYSADSLRFWAAGCKLGDDLPYQEKDLVTGQKFINKLWNASKFVFMHIEKYNPEKVNLGLMDRWFLSKLNRLIMECTNAFNKYEYMRNKIDTENFFWHTLCDNYLEIVKHKLYNPDGNEDTAKYCLYFGLLNVLKLVAPIMPHITEEIYCAYYSRKEKKQSIHISEWPNFDKRLIDDDIEKSGNVVIDIISTVRKYKSKKNLSLNAELNKLIIECTSTNLKRDLESVFNDLKGTLNIKEISFGKAKKECGKIKISIL
jgi:valyl-tRNA synthetase